MEHFIDALGDMCPVPVLKAEKEFKQIKAGEKIILETDHSCSVQSVIDHFESRFGARCTVEEVEEGVWRVAIEKRS